jgi:hypothetical protein
MEQHRKKLQKKLKMQAIWQLEMVLKNLIVFISGPSHLSYLGLKN